MNKKMTKKQDSYRDRIKSPELRTIRQLNTRQAVASFKDAWINLPSKQRLNALNRTNFTFILH